MSMSWSRLLCDRRVGNYSKGTAGKNGDLRSEFEKDYHRIIGSASFRRLQDKTQVFALDKSDFIRTRLTHSLEVSSFARSLGHNIGQYLIANETDPEFTSQTKSDICDILQCAGLIHDIGNPPFGHFGEEAIRDWFAQNLKKTMYYGKPVSRVLDKQMLSDLYHFEGNAQALRQVTKLHFLVNENGMNLTYALLNTIIKYPVSSLQMHPETGNVKEKKMGFFYAEQELYEQISREMGTEGVRHPLTYILEAADDIAYSTADIEDAFKKGFLSYEKLLEELKTARDKSGIDPSHFDPVPMLEHLYDTGKERGVRDPKLYAVQNLMVWVQSRLLYCATYGFTSNYRRIMEGEYPGDLFYGTYGDWVKKSLCDIAYRYAFLSEQILQMEVTAGTILHFLLDHFMTAVLYYDTPEQLSTMEQKWLHLISENYRQVYHIYSRRCRTEKERLYLRILLMTDFVSGMTDSYAKDLYQRITGIT